MLSILGILNLLLDIVWFLVLTQVIISWLINFQVLNIYQPVVAQIWQGLNKILQPIYAPIRRLLPQTGTFDFAPMVVILGIMILRIILSKNGAALS